MTDDKAPLRIVNLQVEAFKRITAIDITPRGNVVKITGKNAQGKSSILDAIYAAICGAEVIQREPIQRGQEKARIRLDMGDIIVTRTFTKKDGGFTTGLTVENADGASYRRPQTLMESLIGALAFDPLEFARMKPAAQFDALKKFAAGVDFDAIEEANQGDYNRRTEANRQIRELDGQIAGIVIPKDTPTEPVDESALVDELSQVAQFNANTNAERERRSQQQAFAAGKTERAEALRHEAFKLEEEAEKLDEEAKAITQALAEAKPIPAAKDVAEVRKRLDDAKKQNADIASAKRRFDLVTKRNETVKKADALTGAIERRNEEKADAIAAAKMPVPGLGFGDKEITLNGVPFDQASDAEKLRISIAIAMANNPRLRVIRMREGSLLDEESMKIIEEMAADRGFQVWAEIVDSSGKIGFVIEDGQVKAANEGTLI